MNRKVLLALGFILLVFRGWAQEVQTDTSLKSDNQIISKDQVPFEQKSPFSDGYDRIIKLNKDTLVVSIQKITQNEILYKYPFNNLVLRIPVFHVKEVISKNGSENLTFKSLSAPVKIAKKDTLTLSDYKLVIVTFKEEDVAGLTELGNLEVRAEGEKATSNTSLIEKNAIFQLRKKAAQLGATKVLVTEKNIETPYGETPTVEMKGIAYK